MNKRTYAGSYHARLTRQRRAQYRIFDLPHCAPGTELARFGQLHSQPALQLMLIESMVNSLWAFKARLHSVTARTTVHNG